MRTARRCGWMRAGGRTRARADDAVAAAALREGDRERGKGKKEKNGGAHIWRGKWRASRTGGWEGEFGGA
jgi:hypothetical protein